MFSTSHLSCRMAGAALAMVFIAPLTHADVVFIDLGAIKGSGESYAYDLSGNGRVVVGEIRTLAAVNPARWTADGGYLNLGNLPNGRGGTAYCASDDGSVVAGTCVLNSGGSRGFRWSESAGLQDIGVLPGFTVAWPLGMSADGAVIVGTANSGSATVNRAFRWTEGAGMQSLGVLAGRSSSYATAASADGATIVGYAYNTYGDARAFRWTVGEGLVNLGTLPSAATSFASAVSADGSVVVGTSGPGLSSGRAVRWVSGVIESLGILPGYTGSAAADIAADASIIVGACSTASASRGFVWKADTGMVDLVEYLVSAGVDLTGWEIQGVSAIASDGSALAGTGRVGGEYRAWLVTGLGAPPCELTIEKEPADVTTCYRESAAFSVAANGTDLAYQWRRNGVDLSDEPGAISGATTPSLIIEGGTLAQAGNYTCMVTSNCGALESTAGVLTACVADYTCDGVVTSQDFFDFLASFFGGDSDVNGAGGTDSQDFFDFLGVFFGGC